MLQLASCALKDPNTPKQKYSPSNQGQQQKHPPMMKRMKHPIGLSISSGSAIGQLPSCKYFHGCIMRTQFCAIRKVTRIVGIGYDIAQFHFCCVKKAISSPELQQLIIVVKASDEDLGLKTTWLSKITNNEGEHKSGWTLIDDLSKK